MKALVGAFNQEKALVGAFSVIIQLVVEPMDRFTALLLAPTHPLFVRVLVLLRLCGLEPLNELCAALESHALALLLLGVIVHLPLKERVLK